MLYKAFRFIGIILSILMILAFIFNQVLIYWMFFIFLIMFFILKVYFMKENNEFKKRRKIMILYNLFMNHCKGKSLRKYFFLKKYPNKCIYYDECKKKYSEKRKDCKDFYFLTLDLIKIKGMIDGINENKKNC